MCDIFFLNILKQRKIELKEPYIYIKKNIERICSKVIISGK